MTPKQKAQNEMILTVAHHDYKKRLDSYAFFKVQNEAVCDDLVQDTFMKTWSYLVKGGKIEMMKAFLYHTLNHLIVDEYRKNKMVSLDVLREKGFEPSSEDPKRLFDILDGKSAILLIQRLPEKYRKIMHMRYVQDLSLKEMSLITGQSKNALAVQVHRGIEKLKLFYKDCINGRYV